MTGVSVLMTAFNAGEYLHHAVTSLMEQTHKEWELILIDNGSHDDSLKTLNSSDERIRLIHLEENIGRTPALKMALELAAHPYVAVLDADDTCRRDRLERQAQFLDANPTVVLVGSCVEVIDAVGEVTGGLSPWVGPVPHDALAERNLFVNSSIMYRRHDAIAVGGYDNYFEYAQDFHLLLKLASRGELVVLPDFLTRLRVYATSYTRLPTARLTRLSDEIALFKLASETLTLSSNGARLNKRRRALVNLEIALLASREFHLRQVVRALYRACRADPRLTWIKYLLEGRPSPNVDPTLSKS